MGGHISYMIWAIGMIALAEMGDKTHVLTMMLVSKYNPLKVIIGVLIASVLSQGIAVAFGVMLASYGGLRIWLSSIAALSFIIFGLWSLRGEDAEKVKKDKLPNLSPILTVIITFFIAELGDKTQLASIGLVLGHPDSALWIVAGAVIGMLIANAVTIIVGLVLLKKLPERTMRLASAAIFILFGFVSIRDLLFLDFGLAVWMTVMCLVAVSLIVTVITYYLLKNERKHNDKMHKGNDQMNQN